MLRVGICDDEPLVAEALKRNILEIADITPRHIEVLRFLLGEIIIIIARLRVNLSGFRVMKRSFIWMRKSMSAIFMEE
ncbi:MAG: hypothetical protein II312_07510 [Lachnospiraceae bacterium]|nr:hypothetical protein [Lachnospiraceae bacterium]